MIDTNKKTLICGGAEVILQLGDVISIIAPQNELLNDKQFIIEYISPNKIKLVNISTFEEIILPISEEGVIGDGSITHMTIISRNQKLGYARQHDLIPGKWINIYFGGELPSVITGEITNLEEDMIEVKTYPDGDVIYINFGYQGIPDDLPITSILIRKPPTSYTRRMEEDVGEEDVGEKEVVLDLEELEKEKEEDDINVIVDDLKIKLDQIIYDADQIQFGDTMGTVEEMTNVDKNKKRHDINVQTNAMLDEMLSNIPASQRNARILNNIHTAINRFVQLRKLSSTFDEYKNVTGIVKEVDKPLVPYLKKFDSQLYWILLVAKNIKKIYVDDDSVLLERDEEEERTLDYEAIDFDNDIKEMVGVIQRAKQAPSVEGVNNYDKYISEMNPYFVPFKQPIGDEDILIRDQVNGNITALINNQGAMTSTTSLDKDPTLSKFVTQRYNLGSTRLRGDSKIAHRVKIAPNDTLALNSVLTLPNATVKFSKINLPLGSILLKSNLSRHFINYWQLLNKYSQYTIVDLDTVNINIEYSNNDFVDDIKHYILSLDDDERKDEQLCNDYLNAVIPTTSDVFSSVKKYMQGTLSVFGAIDYLEPFMVTTQNLAYSQFNQIRQFVYEQIANHDKAFFESAKIFAKLKNYPTVFKTYTNAVQDILKSDLRIQKPIMAQYGVYDNSQQYTSSELLKKIIVEDYGKLFTTGIAFENMPLMYPKELAHVFVDEDITASPPTDDIPYSTASPAYSPPGSPSPSGYSPSEESCPQIVLAKKYRSKEELLRDNDKTIYFDKEYERDKNVPELSKDLIALRQTLPPKKFVEHVAKELMKKYQYNEYEANTTALTFLQDHKKVADGHYAILIDIGKGDEGTDASAYYKRKNNKWVLDENIQLSALITPDTICLLRPKCVYDANEEVCQPIPEVKNKLMEDTLNSIINQFDRKYAISKEKLQQEIDKQLRQNYSDFDVLLILKKDLFYRYNDQQYLLGTTVQKDDTIVVSPYAKLRNLILGQTNFIKRQTDIIKFVNLYTRPSDPNVANVIYGEMETPHWLYCIDTNTKLLPTFLFGLAKAFVEGDDYVGKLNYYIKTIGAKSDEGSMWTDKHSGYPITNIALAQDSGEQTDVLLGDEAVFTAPISPEKLEEKQTETEEAKNISIVVRTLESNMGINLEHQKGFIGDNVIQLLNNPTIILPRGAYNKRRKLAEESGKKMHSYEHMKDSTLLYLTLGMVLIAIQTAIPSIVTKKTFPGCVRGFSGFPTQDLDTTQGLDYIACVAHKIKITQGPWKVIAGQKPDKIVSNIRAFINNYIFENIRPVINQRTEDKIAYLTNAEEDGSDGLGDHSISGWNIFLPPLKKIKIVGLQNIASDFDEKLAKEIRTGGKLQNEYINVLRAKTMLFSYAIQESIQSIVEKQDLMFKNALVPYVNNACCSEQGTHITALEYFSEDDKSIVSNTNIVVKLSQMLNDVTGLVQAPIMLGSADTRRKYPPVSSTFSEDTIYRAFISLCNFKIRKPVPNELLAVCPAKPDFITPDDTTDNIIRTLQETGVKYTDAMFTLLLKNQERRNIIKSPFIDSSSPDLLLLTNEVNAVAALEHMNDEIRQLVEKLKPVVDEYDGPILLKDTSTMRTLKNYLKEDNTSLRKKIIDFLRDGPSKLRLPNRQFKTITNFIQNLSVWEFDIDTAEGLSNYVTYFKNSVKFMSTVFPTMIITNHVVEYNPSAHKHLKLSGAHVADLSKMIDKYYAPVQKYITNLNALTSNEPEIVLKLYELLENAENVSAHLVNMAINTPANFHIKGEHYSALDKDIIRPLLDNYLLQVLNCYVVLTEQDPDNDENDYYHIQSNITQNIRDILLTGISLLVKNKEIINTSYSQIIDNVFFSKEYEKYTFTDRLSAMTDEERRVDMILKINKMGVWSKGLMKGLKEYDPQNYDEERIMAHNIATAQRKYDVGPPGTVEFEEAIDEQEEEHEEMMEKNEYLNLGEDYDDGEDDEDWR